MPPQVSYIMAAFNHESHVGSMIESVIAQTHQDWELIAIDDGSSDATADVLKRYAVREPRIRIEVQPNAGIVPTRNRGVTLSSGEFLSFIDSDDLLLPTRTEKLLEALLSNSRAVLAYGDAWIENNEGKRERFWSKYPVVEGSGPAPLLKGGCFIPALSVLVRRESFLATGPLWGGGASTDYLKWLDLSLLGELERVKTEPLAVWRHHGENLSQSLGQGRVQQYLTLAKDLEEFQSRAKMKGFLIDARTVELRRGHCLAMAGFYSVVIGAKDLGHQYLKQSMKLYPTFRTFCGVLLTVQPVAKLGRVVFRRLL